MNKTCRFLAIVTSLFCAIILPACSTPNRPVQPTAGPSAAPESSIQWPTQGWQTSTPAEQGIDSQKLAQMQEYIQSTNLNLHSLLIIRNGYLVSETYYQNFNLSMRHTLYSCTKSFVSTLAGIAIDQGLLEGVTGKVLDFFPNKSIQDVDPEKESMVLEDLLTMTSGLDWVESDSTYQAMYISDDWVSYVLDLPMIETPGDVFNYCTGCTHVIAAIVQQKVGQNLLDYARKNLFEPLGIKDFYWETDKKRNPIGGWGLNLTPRDMAKLGYLFLHNGAWDGKQVVSSAWVETATRKHVEFENRDGYGYQWWTFSPGAYAALGRYGQTIYVLPALDLIVVTTAEVSGHELIFPLINNYILPAVTP